MMTIIPTIPVTGGSILNTTYADAIAKGVAANVAGAALKAAIATRVSNYAEEMLSKLASIRNRKLAAYRIKEEIARDVSIATAGQLANIDREAAARGLDRAGLFAVIIATADAYRETVLLVEAMEAETMAAIAAIDDADPDIDPTIETLLDAAQTEAESAFDVVAAQIAAAA